MDFLPVELENIILDNKKDIEFSEHKKKFQKSLDLISDKKWMTEKKYTVDYINEYFSLDKYEHDSDFWSDEFYEVYDSVSPDTATEAEDIISKDEETKDEETKKLTDERKLELRKKTLKRREERKRRREELDKAREKLYNRYPTGKALTVYREYKNYTLLRSLIEHKPFLKEKTVVIRQRYDSFPNL